MQIPQWSDLAPWTKGSAAQYAPLAHDSDTDEVESGLLSTESEFSLGNRALHAMSDRLQRGYHPPLPVARSPTRLLQHSWLFFSNYGWRRGQLFCHPTENASCIQHHGWTACEASRHSLSSSAMALMFGGLCLGEDGRMATSSYECLFSASSTLAQGWCRCSSSSADTPSATSHSFWHGHENNPRSLIVLCPRRSDVASDCISPAPLSSSLGP